MSVTSTVEKSIGKQIGEFLAGCAFLVALGGMLWAAYAGYGWLDAVGAISHDRTIAVQLKGGWMVGETRRCNSWCVGSTVDGLNCIGSDQDSARQGTSHKLSAKFWGKMERPDAAAALVAGHPTAKGQWDCKRGPEALTCWALN